MTVNAVMFPYTAVSDSAGSIIPCLLDSLSMCFRITGTKPARNSVNPQANEGRLRPGTTVSASHPSRSNDLGTRKGSRRNSSPTWRRGTRRSNRSSPRRRHHHVGSRARATAPSASPLRSLLHSLVVVGRSRRTRRFVDRGSWLSCSLCW